MSREALRATFTNEVIRAVGALARQQNVCREQDGKAVFVTGMDAAREYIVEHVQKASAEPSIPVSALRALIEQWLSDAKAITSESEEASVKRFGTIMDPDGYSSTISTLEQCASDLDALLSSGGGTPTV